MSSSRVGLAPLAAFLAVAMCDLSACAAPLSTLVINTVEPTTNVLVSQAVNNQLTRAFDSDGTNSTQNGTTGQTATTR